jgi:radical SAM superfamily enzyme YgiQ (UPF0313 family)
MGNGVKIKIHVTSSRPQITYLDGLPIPDRSLLDYEKYNLYIGQAMVKNSIVMQASRGCPFKCSYCFNVWPKRYVVRSAQHLFDEMQLFYDMGVRRFAFIDDIFNLEIENSKRFFQLIIKNRLNMDVQILFSAGLRGDILTREYIDLMVEAGTINLALALETASMRLQKLIGKNLNVEKLRENIDYFCKQYPHVILELYTMHGFPTETEEEALMTLDFIKSIRWLHFPYVNVLRIYPNTAMEELALAHHISPQAIARSESFSYDELPETLPFKKSFTFEYQTRFLHEYFLSKERLLHVLTYQRKVFTEDEIVQKYNSYLPSDIKCFNDILEFAGIKKDELEHEDCLDEDHIFIPQLNERMKCIFPQHKMNKDAFRILLLDLSQFFSGGRKIRYDVVEPPYGLMCLLTYLKRELGTSIQGRIAKSRIDFDSYMELFALIVEFKPDLIGIRTLTFYKDFFYEAAARIREFGINVPIIAGGPHATCDYKEILQEGHVDLVVLGEGELTFTELVEKIIANDGRLPGDEALKGIAGIVFTPGKTGPTVLYANESRSPKGKDELWVRFNEDLENE